MAFGIRGVVRQTVIRRSLLCKGIEVRHCGNSPILLTCSVEQTQILRRIDTIFTYQTNRLILLAILGIVFRS